MFFFLYLIVIKSGAIRLTFHISFFDFIFQLQWIIGNVTLSFVFIGVVCVRKKVLLIVYKVQENLLISSRIESTMGIIIAVVAVLLIHCK